VDIELDGQRVGERSQVGRVGGDDRVTPNQGRHYDGRINDVRGLAGRQQTPHIAGGVLGERFQHTALQQASQIVLGPSSPRLGQLPVDAQSVKSLPRPPPRIGRQRPVLGLELGHRAAPLGDASRVLRRAGQPGRQADPFRLRRRSRGRYRLVIQRNRHLL
jgi:hypothetical protein